MRLRRFFVIISAFALTLAFSLTALGCNGNGTTPSGLSTEFIESERNVTQTKLVTYDGPGLITTSDKMNVSVEGEELFVYETLVNHQRVHNWATPKDKAQVVIFAFEGSVNMSVTLNGNYSDISEAVVRPLAYGITPAISGNTITFKLENTDNYVLEFAAKMSVTGQDGNPVVTDIPAYKNALHIFANPIEINPVDPDDEDVVYIAPGVYQAGAIPVSDNQTVYLAGGAVVFGQFRAEGVNNLTIRGHGILSGEVYSRVMESEFTLPFEMRSCKNLKIEDITILDPAGWAVTLLKCDGVEINNLKIITARSNGDGISVQSSKNVRVNGGFVRSWDDSLVVKAVDDTPTESVVFDGVTVWTDLAQSMEVGFEAHGEYIKNITFQNITVLHNFHKAVMSIHNADKANITSITYKNITVEDGRMLGDVQDDGQNDFLIDFGIAYNADWSSSADGRGYVRDITVENVKILNVASTVISRMEGENASANISNVTLKDIYFAGVFVSSTADLKLTPGNNVSNVSVANVRQTITGASVKLKYKNSASGSPSKTKVASTVQEGVEVPEFAFINAEPTYMGMPMSIGGDAAKATHGNGDRPSAAFDDGSGAFSRTGYGAERLIDGDRDTAWRAAEWKGGEYEFAALTFTFGEKDGGKFTGDKVAAGIIRIYLPQDNKCVYNFNLRVLINSNETPDSFVGMVTTRRYSVTPANGNYFDIILSGIPMYQMQLRMYRTDDMFTPAVPEIAEIEFLPLSLTTGKAIVASTPNADVYSVDNVVDGFNDTYFQALSIGESYLVIDMGAVYDFRIINLHLPGILTWEPRKQEIAIEISDSPYAYTASTVFSVLSAKKEYLFDSATGNVNTIELEEAASARFIKIRWFSNKNLVSGEYVESFGGQLSEIYVY